MKNINRIFVLFLACACLLFAGTAPAALTDPAQIQTEAYVNLVQADQSLDAGRLDEALTQYKVARDYYLQLAQDFPGWEPRVIQYRKTYCDNQIADVEHRQIGGQPEELPELAPELAPEPTAPVAAPVVAAAPEPEPASASERSVEIDYLKSRITSLEAELTEFDTVQNELDAVTAQNEQLKKDIAAAKQQLSERENSEKSALDGLRAELAGKDEQLKALEKEIEAKKQLDQALNDMEGKVNELRNENDRLNKEIKTLDGEIDDAEVRADQADLQAKQAEAKLKDAETDAQKARALQADAEQELAALQRKPIIEKPARDKVESEPQAKAAPEPKAKPEAKPVEKAKEEPKATAATSRVMATVPPKPIPDGMSAADYVRQLLQEGDNDSALATVQEARKTRPADMNLPLIEGITLIRLQRYPEAATLLIDLAKNSPQNAEVHATLGAAMMGAGFYEEARETLLMAAKLDKNLPECQYNLAQLYAFIDPINLKLARKYYQQARDLGLAADPQLEKALK
jgi:Flp pilus assembly protein TadD